MKFTFVGTGTAAPSGQLRPSCIYFDFDGFTGLLDLGAGAIHSMASMGIDPIHIGNVFFSHYHSDHVADLIMMLHSNNSTPGKIRTKALSLNGPVGLQRLVQTVMEQFPETVPENYEVNVVEEKPAGFSVHTSGIRVSCCKTGHTEYSIAHRFQSPDRTFVYTGDCAFSSDLCDFCRGADVLITECSYTDDCRTEDHLCVHETALLAKNAGVGNLVIVHRYPETVKTDIIPELKEIYAGHIMIPSDGEEIFFE